MPNVMYTGLTGLPTTPTSRRYSYELSCYIVMYLVPTSVKYVIQCVCLDLTMAQMII